MKDLFKKIREEGEWKPLRFMVYNYLDEKESYQLNLKQHGFGYSYDELEGKTFQIDNMLGKQFKRYVENVLQNGRNVVIAVCVIDKMNSMTIVKPKEVEFDSILKLDDSE